jgi:hypothetical protein
MIDSEECDQLFEILDIFVGSLDACLETQDIALFA